MQLFDHKFHPYLDKYKITGAPGNNWQSCMKVVISIRSLSPTFGKGAQCVNYPDSEEASEQSSPDKITYKQGRRGCYARGAA